MKLFTVQEAESLIPRLREELGSVRAAYDELEKRWESVAAEEKLSVADHRVREICMNRQEVRDALKIINQGLAFFYQEGVLCKGLDCGVFDFPCLLQDRMVYLCWHWQEDRISFWHEIDTGFAGRKPLFEATRLHGAEYCN